MAYAALCDYIEYLGQPEFEITDFNVFAAVASDQIDQLTRFSIPAVGFSSLPELTQTLIKKAVSMQILYIYDQGGLSALGNDSAGGFTVGKVSVSGGKSTASSKATLGSLMISPASVALLEQTGLMNPAVPLGGCPIC